MKLKNLNFGDALANLKNGERISRDGWNGRGMYIYYVKPNKYKAVMECAKGLYPDDMVPYNAYMAIKNVDNTISTWVPSVNDVLAEDWCVL